MSISEQALPDSGKDKIWRSVVSHCQGAPLSSNVLTELGIAGDIFIEAGPTIVDTVAVPSDLSRMVMVVCTAGEYISS